jgi:hypothetical protein
MQLIQWLRTARISFATTVVSWSLLSLIAIVTAGCAGNSFRADVSAFHLIDKPPKSTRFAIVPMKHQVDSLEFAQYAATIWYLLKRYGYEQVPLDSADLILEFDYSVNGRTKLSTVPIIGVTGVQAATTYGTANVLGSFGTYSGTTYFQPQYGLVGFDTVAETVYRKTLVVHIAEKPPADSKHLNYLFQGTVRTDGGSDSIHSVLRGMIFALF